MTRAEEVKPLSNHRLDVLFDNGERRIFDVTPYLNGPWYSDLLDENVFRSVCIAGISVEWPGGQDIAPDCLYHNSVPWQNP